MDLKTSYGEKYEKYIESPEWKRIRANRVEEANGICEKCRWPMKGSEVHHDNYDNLGHEGVEDTRTMHENCHSREHDKPTGTDRYGRGSGNAS